MSGRNWLAQNRLLPGTFHPWVSDPETEMKTIEAEKGSALDSITVERPKSEQLTNCKNCGAPLHGSRCEYCGTEYGPEPMLILKGQPADMDKLIDQLHKTGIVPVKSETEVTKL